VQAVDCAILVVVPEVAMQFSRRQILHLAVGGAAIPVASPIARAQTYPTKPVRIVDPVAAGGSNDVTARLIGQWLSEHLGQQFLIENRPGGAGNIGTEAVVRAPADGYTLLLAASTAAINATLFEKLPFNFIRDIAPVASIVRVPQVMQVNPSLPVTTVPEFIAYAKSNPGKIAMGSGGNGSPAHVAGELFKMLTGTNMTHVPYRGAAPAVTDLLGGQIQVTFTEMATSIGFIRTAGKLRALAVTTATRSEALPDIPTLSSFLPGFEASQWIGLVAPEDTPAEIIDKLNREINAARRWLAEVCPCRYAKTSSNTGNKGDATWKMSRRDADLSVVWQRLVRPLVARLLVTRCPLSRRDASGASIMSPFRWRTPLQCSLSIGRSAAIQRQHILARGN
jgi:tripartite-type tricarboxylate transporter receptor subunit TctC